MGEGAGGGGQNGDHLVPPPLHPLPPKEGRFWKDISEKVRNKFSDYIVQVSTPNHQNVLNFGFWSLDIIWNLKFGVWDFFPDVFESLLHKNSCPLPFIDRRNSGGPHRGNIPRDEVRDFFDP